LLFVVFIFLAPCLHGEIPRKTFQESHGVMTFPTTSPYITVVTFTEKKKNVS